MSFNPDVTMIEAVETATFGQGVILALRERQAVIRTQSLKALGNGLFETLAPVEFKRGEKLGLHGRITKAMRSARHLREIAHSQPTAPVVRPGSTKATKSRAEQTA